MWRQQQEAIQGKIVSTTFTFSIRSAVIVQLILASLACLTESISFARNTDEFSTLVASLQLQGDVGQRRLESWLEQAVDVESDAEIEQAMRRRCNVAIAWFRDATRIGQA